MKIEDIVLDVHLHEPLGGHDYYEMLDGRLRTSQVFHDLVDAVEALHPRATLIVSGEFGREFKRWASFARPGTRVILVQGGLRYNPHPSIEPWELRGAHPLVFVDDTLYAGRTRDAVERALHERGYWLDGTVVAYAARVSVLDGKTHALYVAEPEKYGGVA